MNFSTTVRCHMFLPRKVKGPMSYVATDEPLVGGGSRDVLGPEALEDSVLDFLGELVDKSVKEKRSIIMSDVIAAMKPSRGRPVQLTSEILTRVIPQIEAQLGNAVLEDNPMYEMLETVKKLLNLDAK